MGAFDSPVSESVPPVADLRHWITVSEAAARLGITKHGVREGRGPDDGNAARHAGARA
jgi:hypothetical protein